MGIELYTISINIISMLLCSFLVFLFLNLFPYDLLSSDCIEGASVLSMAKTDVQASSTSYNYDFENSTGVSTELTREDITSAANTLIDDLNNKRKQDTQLMDDFKKALELQVQIHEESFNCFLLILEWKALSVWQQNNIHCIYA